MVCTGARYVRVRYTRTRKQQGFNLGLNLFLMRKKGLLLFSERSKQATNVMLPDWYFSRIWNFQEKIIKIIIFPEVSILHYFEARSFVNRKYSSKCYQTQQLTVRFGFSIKIRIFEKCFLKFSFFSKFSFFLPNLKFGFPFYRIPILPRKKVQLQKS